MALENPGATARADDCSEAAAQLLARGHRGLTFPDGLEPAYQAQTAARDSRMLLYGGLIGILLFNLFLICDYLLIPDMWDQALLLRLYVFDPVAIGFALWLLAAPPPPRVQKLYVAMACLLDAGIIVWLFSNSMAPGAVVYQSGLLLVVMGMNIMLQLSFWYALWASVLVLAMQALGTLNSALLDTATGVYSMLVLLTTVVVSLLASYRLERDQRFAWLVELRERGRNQKLEALNRQLEALSQRDALTGIANRRCFDDSLASLWRLAQARGASISLLMIDVDHFKHYNDRYGHPAGDECLRRVATAIQSVMRRDSGLAARYGGEEFAVLLPDMDLDEALHVAGRVLQAVDALQLPHAASPGTRWVSISAGAASCVPPPDTGETALVQAADFALYRAKAEGRHRVHPARQLDTAAA